MSTAPAIIYCLATFVAVLFQFGLALGVPWGHLAMGGKFPGKFPPAMRVAAVVQALVLCGLAGVVLIRAKMILPSWYDTADWAIWVVVGFAAISVAMNSITPSRWERIIWVPVGAVLLVCSLLVAYT